MKTETISIKVNYSAAGLNGDGLCPTLERYPVVTTMGYKKTAVIICPGGGYEFVSEREAEPIAIKFASLGFAPFILNYSCVKKKFPTALLEAAEAVRFVRSHADEYGIDPNKIAVMGFSAGGHLAASIANFWHEDFLSSALGCKKEDIKVNCSVLCYPVITFGEYTHEGSRDNICLGDKELEELNCLENRVNPNTPPTFIWHTSDDGCVPVENSLFYTLALSKNHIPFEAHIYPFGGHGLSLADRVTAWNNDQIIPNVQPWAELAAEWLNRF